MDFEIIPGHTGMKKQNQIQITDCNAPRPGGSLIFFHCFGGGLNFAMQPFLQEFIKSCKFVIFSNQGRNTSPKYNEFNEFDQTPLN